MFTRPRPATVLALTTAAAIGASLTGCGDSTASASPGSPSATATHRHSTPAATGSASPSSTGGSSSSPRSTNTTAAGAPGVPDPARQHTTKGAIAFAKHYTDVLNKSGKTAEVGLLEPLSLKSCKTCANYEENVRTLSRMTAHNNGPQVKYHSAKRITGETGVVVNALVDQTKMNVVDSSGKTVKKYPLIEDLGLVFFLDWTPRGWRVKEIKVDHSRVR